MSSHVGLLGTDGSEEEGSERPDRILTVRGEETWRRNPSLVGRASGVNFLVRPALPGRKAHRSWYREEVRGRRQERGQTEQEGEPRTNSEVPDIPQRASSRCNNGRWAQENEGQATNASSATMLRSEPLLFSSSSPEEQDPFWVEVRSRAGNPRSSSQAVTDAQDRQEGEEEDSEEGEEEEEEDGGEGGSGVTEVQGRTVNPELLVPAVSAGDRRMSRREKNRMKCLRRRQRKRERWRQLQGSQQSSTADPSSSSSSSSEEDEDLIRDGYICAVCLDVYFCPYMCHPCSHIFCEPCLRTLAKNSPTNTPCPLCRTIITHVFFQKELNQTARTFFPKEYLSRKQNFQKASCAKWPLPSCRKLFRIFGGFQRQSSPMARRRFPHSGSFRMDTLDFEDQSPAGWRLDMDMVIIYIYSVNWIIGFFIFCLLCYIFFPSL